MAFPERDVRSSKDIASRLAGICFTVLPYGTLPLPPDHSPSQPTAVVTCENSAVFVSHGLAQPRGPQINLYDTQTNLPFMEHPTGHLEALYGQDGALQGYQLVTQTTDGNPIVIPLSDLQIAVDGKIDKFGPLEGRYAVRITGHPTAIKPSEVFIDRDVTLSGGPVAVADQKNGFFGNAQKVGQVDFSGDSRTITFTLPDGRTILINSISGLGESGGDNPLWVKDQAPLAISPTDKSQLSPLTAFVDESQLAVLDKVPNLQGDQSGLIFPEDKPLFSTAIQRTRYEFGKHANGCIVLKMTDATGAEKVINMGMPDGKELVYFNDEQGNRYSLDVKSHRIAPAGVGEVAGEQGGIVADSNSSQTSQISLAPQGVLSDEEAANAIETKVVHPDKSFVDPVPDPQNIRRKFGAYVNYQTGNFHDGVDYGTTFGDDIKAPLDSIVAYAGWDPKFEKPQYADEAIFGQYQGESGKGNSVWLYLGNTSDRKPVFIVFNHLQGDIPVKVDGVVKAGSTIGHAGRTGYTGFDHSHVEVLVGNASLDGSPANYPLNNLSTYRYNTDYQDAHTWIEWLSGRSNTPPRTYYSNSNVDGSVNSDERISDGAQAIQSDTQQEKIVPSVGIQPNHTVNNLVAVQKPADVLPNRATMKIQQSAVVKVYDKEGRHNDADVARVEFEIVEAGRDIPAQGFNFGGLLTAKAYKIAYKDSNGNEKEGYVYVGDVTGIQDLNGTGEANMQGQVQTTVEDTGLSQANLKLDSKSVLADPFKDKIGVEGPITKDNFDKFLFAGSYGIPGGLVGTLGACNTTDEMFSHTDDWAKWVEQKFPDKEVVRVLFPVWKRTHLAQQLVEETKAKNEQGKRWVVMLTLESGTESSIQDLISTTLQQNSDNPHIGFMLDIEHFGRAVSISELNRLAKYYANERKKLGFSEVGTFGVWFFRDHDLIADEPMQTKLFDPESGDLAVVSVPIFDGYGGANAKWSGYNSMSAKFGADIAGMMDFTWRWGRKYDTDSTASLFGKGNVNPSVRFFTQQ